MGSPSLGLLKQIDKLFDTGFYFRANEDVAQAGIEPFLHFLSHGLKDGRAPSASMTSKHCTEMLAESVGSEKELQRQLRHIRNVQLFSKNTVLRATGREIIVGLPFWACTYFQETSIDLSYILFSDNWPVEQNTRKSAVEYYRSNFREKVLPFSYELEPDESFFEALYGDSLRALEIQKKWAQSRTPFETIVSLRHFTQHYCGDSSLIFNGFDHLEYIAKNPQVSQEFNEIQAFVHFISVGLAQGYFPPASSFQSLKHIIDARLEHLHEAGSYDFFPSALKLQGAGFQSGALNKFAFQQAIGAGDLTATPKGDHSDDLLASFWISYFQATAHSDLGRHPEAVGYAQKALEYEPGSVLALEKVHDTVSRWHESMHRLVQMRAKSLDEMPAEGEVSEGFAQILQNIPSFGSPGKVTSGLVLTSRKGKSIRRIGILADQSLPQCKRYRIDQKMEYLADLGIEAKLYDTHLDVEKAVGECGLFDAWILYRTPAYYSVLKLLQRARILNITTIFEIDDLILDPVHFPEPRENYGSGVDDNQFSELKVLPFLYAAVARNCDFGLASTEALADRLKDLVLSNQCFVLRNGLDAMHMSALDAVREPDISVDSDVTKVFVSSATKSHKDYVSKIFLPQAIDVAKENPGKIHFSLCGEFGELMSGLDEESLRSINHLELSWDYTKYISTLAGFDINVVPLEKTDFTDCKSGIKWLEAGLLNIPSILAPTHTHERCINDGVTGILARNHNYAHPLRHLCANVAERREIGKKAHDVVVSEFSFSRQSEALASILEKIGSRT